MRINTCMWAWDMTNVEVGDCASNRRLQASYVACIALVHLASNPLWKITKAAGRNDIGRHEGAFAQRGVATCLSSAPKRESTRRTLTNTLIVGQALDKWK